MSARLSLARSLAAGAVLLVAVACGGDSEPSGPDGSAPATGGSAPVDRKAPTKEDLQSALLTTKDLPAGYKITENDNGDPDNGDPGDAGCRTMKAIDAKLYQDGQPDQVAHAAIEFETPDSSGGGDQLLAGFTSEDAAKQLYGNYVRAAQACRALKLRLDPATTVTLTGTPLTRPTLGDESRSFRYLGSVKGVPFWMDAAVVRVGGTVALVTAGGVGAGPDAQRLPRIAGNAVAKLG